MHIWVVFESESWFTKPALDKGKKDLFNIDIKISGSRSEFVLDPKPVPYPLVFGPDSSVSLGTHLHP